jgi:glutathione S-transferase
MVARPKEKSMLKLYARPGSGSAAIEAILAECNAPHTVIDVPRDADGSTPASLFRLNPRGEIPILVLDDDSVMTESAAMVVYLADLYPAAGLAPGNTSPLRPRYLKWLLYLAVNVYGGDLRMYYPERYSTVATHAKGIKAKAISDMERDFDVLALDLGRGPYILGEVFSAVDLYAAMLVSWANDVPALFARHPNIKAHYDLVAARPQVAKIWARNNMPA